jgi:sodium/hydrogen exchanger 8
MPWQYYSDDVPFSHSTLPVAISNFVFVSLGSIFAGFAMALACCYICKHTQLRDYPKYEISLLFLFAYGAYAFAEAISLSGVMALFFCGVILSHYNSYNLSKPSAIAAEHIFKSLAVMAEFFVFLYMGMGFFTGRFRRWNLVFIVFATFFCLLARFFNIFPISFLANLGRRQKIPFKMQVRGTPSLSLFYGLSLCVLAAYLPILCRLTPVHCYNP